MFFVSTSCDFKNIDKVYHLLNQCFLSLLFSFLLITSTQKNFESKDKEKNEKKGQKTDKLEKENKIDGKQIQICTQKNHIFLEGRSKLQFTETRQEKRPRARAVPQAPRSLDPA